MTEQISILKRKQHRKYYNDKKHGLHVSEKKRICINCKTEFLSFNEARMCNMCKRPLKSKKVDYDMVKE
jgi:hypothetical protein